MPKMSHDDNIVTNKYYQYFIANENERKRIYMDFYNMLVEDRKQFIKNPTTYKFDRDDNSIQVLDSI